ncbi:hypothetical protein [Gordonia hongkongensis]|uniref:hypothetical protein n=1 Tax=Gordonia hongkongensis TaxID=1701090 RepID=UPI001FF7CA33|nr:hypothetical protein [Gordonia hongkongensis]UPG66506.1 hypothetical protein MVF96_13360 [Gordonia hongkongensis]
MHATITTQERDGSRLPNPQQLIELGEIGGARFKATGNGRSLEPPSASFSYGPASSSAARSRVRAYTRTRGLLAMMTVTPHWRSRSR